MSRNKFLLLGLLTIVGFSLVGFVLRYFFSAGPVFSIFLADNVVSQLFFGGLFGVLVAVLGIKLINTPYLKQVKHHYTGVLQSIEMRNIDILIISICAGVGEEILFRGAIQEYFGIWITSILFVAIHGYLNPKNLPLTVYGVYMTVMIAVLGFMYEHIGIYAPIAAHTVIDLILLWKIKQTKIPSFPMDHPVPTVTPE